MTDTAKCYRCGDEHTDSALRNLHGRRYCHPCWKREAYKSGRNLRDESRRVGHGFWWHVAVALTLLTIFIAVASIVA